MSDLCLQALRALSPDQLPRLSVSAPRRLAVEDFELWRPRVARWLLIAVALLLAYWAVWFADRQLVASSSTPAYIAFEQAFPLADAWLAAAALIAAVRLEHRTPSALLWLFVVGGAGVYLCALDVLYDLQHGIYANGSSGVFELTINLLTLVSSLGVLNFGWRFRSQLLGVDRPPDPS